MTRKLGVALLCVSAAACGQTDIAPHFEVATVKLSNAEPGSTSGIRTAHGMIDAKNVTLRRCVMGAYGVGPTQIVGGPAWLDSVRFEIVGKSDQPNAGDEALMAMLQSLLAERFKLAAHRETRMLPAFVLEVGSKGARLERSQGGEGKTESRSGISSVELDARNSSMDHFADVLSRQMDRPVVNRTGLEGIYNVKLQWTPERLRSARSADGATVDGPSIFTAIQEQLGLHLRSAKAPVKIVVIDRAEMPGEN